MQTNDFSDIPIIDLTNAGERDVLARAVRWHLEARVLRHGNKPVVFA